MRVESLLITLFGEVNSYHFLNHLHNVWGINATSLRIIDGLKNLKPNEVHNTEGRALVAHRAKEVSMLGRNSCGIPNLWKQGPPGNGIDNFIVGIHTSSGTHATKRSSFLIHEASPVHQ